MKLMAMTVKDFCGIKELQIDFLGRSCTVRGRNASGKSTINNAFLWCLFGKGTNGKELDPKPRNTETGERIIGNEPSVELVIRDDVKQVTLKKSLAEDFSDKKTNPVYKGDKSIYEIDGLTVLKKQYDEEVKNFVGDMDVFRLITEPHTFLSSSKWEDRRKTLTKLMGDVKPEDALSESDIELLNGKPISVACEIAKASLKKAEERAELIPKLMKENSDKVVAVLGHRESLEKQSEEIRISIDRLINLSTDGGMPRLKEIETEIKMLIAQQDVEVKAVKDTRTLNKRACDTKRKQIASELGFLNNEMKLLETNIIHTQKILEELRAEYKTISDTVFTKVACPTCGNEMPEFMVEELEQKFNQNRAESLKTNIEKGKAAKKRLEDFEKQMTSASKKKELLNKELDVANTKYAEAEAEENADIPSMYEKAIQDLRDEYDRLSSAPRDKKPEIDLEKIKELEKTMASIDDNIYHLRNNESIKERIQELKSELDTLNDTIAELKRIKALTLDVQRKYNEKMEERLNSLFSVVKWKLFETQKNGETIDRCEAMIDGVEYNQTLNTGSKIMASIDTSNTFSKYFSVEFPVFIDNAEAVTDWTVLPMNQTIKLFAAEIKLFADPN